MRRADFAADERGYTLFELLTAGAAGLAVCAAALAVVVSALRLGQSDGERLDADQQGSVAMERIVQALKSSCVEGVGVSPIVGVTGGTGLTGSTAAPPSSGNSVTFFSSLTDAPSIVPSEIVVALNGAGQLVMKNYPYSAGSYATTPASTFVLIGRAANTTGYRTIFSYYGYDTSTGMLSNVPLGGTGATGATSPLGATAAARTAEVAVNLRSLPSDGNDPTGAYADFSDAVVLRLTAVSDIVPPTGSTTPQPCS